jgi:RNA polymerase sigma-70 factor (ECF subfamily)
MKTKTIEVTGDGRQERFNALMESTYRKVYNMAFRLAGNRSDAEDLTQEAYYRAYRSFDDYEGDKPFENWIFRIVTRLFLDLLRSRRRRVQTVSYDAPLPTVGDDTVHFDVADANANADQNLVNNTMSEDLQNVLATLSQEQRTLVLLADVEGLPYKEISELMGKPVGTIRSRLHRTHKVMRQRLEAIRAQRSGKPSARLGNMGFCLSA